MNKWLGNIKIRNIKDVKIRTYYESGGTECREIELIDKEGNVYTIEIRLDAKEARE